jgi:hypothetical protein
VNQGWKIHRIWSTDWFKGRNTEVSRLLQKLQALLADDPEHQLAMQRARKVSSLRSRLIALRDDELRVSFPDAPPEACLLRDSLLETFVVKRPKTRDDWFRVMSYQQRAETDSRQVGKYLEKVLQIIGDCSD